MIKAYALQSELLSSGPVCRYLYEKFGYSRGRVIARYPEEWVEMVKASLGDCQTMERHTIIERLVMIQRSALLPRDHDWDKGKMWLDNAIEEHTKRPFDAIISQNNPNNVAAVIREADLDEEKEPRWRAETQRRIERTAREMAACAALLLRYAKEILFIDPHFNPQARRFQQPLKAFLQEVAKRPASNPVNRIEIHTGHAKTGTKDFFHAECVKHLPSIIPRGMKIRLVRWDQTHLHNRFILTDSGGLKFSHGLDDHNGRPPKHDIVDLLEQEPYKATWKEYQRGSSNFPLIEDDLIVKGTA